MRMITVSDNRHAEPSERPLLNQRVSAFHVTRNSPNRPGFPSSISGVGNYACLLARQLRAAHGIDTRFLVCDPYGSEKPEIDGFAVERLGDLSGR
jgi:hypothetical protein